MTSTAATTTTSARRAPIPPDDIPPGIEGAPHTRPGGYDRYGFRVPTVIVSPYARAELRLARRARPDVDPEAHRDEVEPAGAHLPRRQREQPARVSRLRRAACVPRATESSRAWPVSVDAVGLRSGRRRRDPATGCSDPRASVTAATPRTRTALDAALTGSRSLLARGRAAGDALLATRVAGRRMRMWHCPTASR